ncbi:ATP-binding protein [Streptomyces sp. 8L]|uniref:ATP-binding protein n=1 Tax=Streptomyces sp. 8L TaxID=2877242 RepID=UPI001CD1D815|nr:ATP-binding protein [Streptomyces sp. 8L]MCA1219178.1 ATP-binding protein [Streptomyces sp. 8L]
MPETREQASTETTQVDQRTQRPSPFGAVDGADRSALVRRRSGAQPPATAMPRTETTRPTVIRLGRPMCVAVAPHLHLVPHVRHAIVAALHLWGIPEIADDMGLIATELVANAVQYGEPTCVTVVFTVSDGLAVLEVTDDNGERPAVRQTAEDDEGGRGLILVRALAERWGCRHGTRGRKTVWASLSLQGRAA